MSEIMWFKSVLEDFGIDYDDHDRGRKLALTQWMADANKTIAELNATIKELGKATAQEWISVKDRLPPKDDDIVALSMRQGGVRFVAWYSKVHDVWKYTGGDPCGYTYEKPSFTHWMPLPDPPKEKP